MNRLKALIAAFLVTAVVGCGMLALGLAVAFNPKGVAASDSPVSQAAAVDPASAVTASTDAQALAQAQAQIAQLQDLIGQYKTREQQYQSQIGQANSAVQQYQQVLMELQQAGVIRIGSDGRIFIGRGFRGDDDGNGG